MLDVVEKIAARVLRVTAAEAKSLNLNDGDARKAVLEAVTLAVGNPDLHGDELTTFFEAHLEEEADKGGEYAASYLAALTAKKKRLIEKTYRPSYDKAVKAGVDPVSFLRADLGLTEEEAGALVTELKNQDEQIAATDDGWDSVPATPGPAPDVRAGAVAPEGEYA